MGLFRRAGRKLERFKQSLEDAADGEVSHVCQDCDARFYAGRETCPECGGLVVAMEPDS